MQRLQDRFVVQNNCWALHQIKYPELMKHEKYSRLIYNPNVYVKLENSYLVLKQKHPNGYF